MSKRELHNRLEIRKHRCSYVFEHFNEHYLRVEQNCKNKQFSYDVDLAVLKPDGHYEMNIPWNWLIASATAIGVLAGMLAHVVFNLSPKKILIFIPLIIVVVVFIFLALQQFRRGYERKLIFLSRYAAFPVVQVPYDPHNKRFFQFITMLEQEIESSINKRRIPDEVLQAGEMKTLRRLANEGILSKNQYNTAKNRIFKNLEEVDDL